MEKILQQILEKLNSMDARIANLEQGQAKLEQGQAKLDNRIANLEHGQTKLDNRIANLEHGQQEIKDHLIQLDAKNADRHREINHKIDSLSKDFTVVEAVTGKNMTDIAHLKSIK